MIDIVATLQPVPIVLLLRSTRDRTWQMKSKSSWNETLPGLRDPFEFKQSIFCLVQLVARNFFSAEVGSQKDGIHPFYVI